jgi:hypothetical protein
LRYHPPPPRRLLSRLFLEGAPSPCCLRFITSQFMTLSAIESRRHHGGTMSTSSPAERRQWNAWLELPRLASSGWEASEASRVAGSQTPRPRRWVLGGPRCCPPILRDLSLDVLRQLPFHGIHAPIMRNLPGPAPTIQFNTGLAFSARPLAKQARTVLLLGRPNWHNYRLHVPISGPPSTVGWP